jgi:hypothetical protein
MSALDTDYDGLAALADEKIALGQQLINQLEMKFKDINGIRKVERTIMSELKFLEKVKILK